MVCYLEFTSSNIDDAALLNVNFISNTAKYLLWEAWVLFVSLKKSPENRIPPAENEKRLAFLQMPTNVQVRALKSWLPYKDALKCRFWALAILNNVQIPPGPNWRRYRVRFFVFFLACFQSPRPTSMELKTICILILSYNHFVYPLVIKQGCLENPRTGYGGL